ncbi:MAG: hypothetical protein K6G58_09195 [Lachnospiraceae bacterium]|nr:hypothetical protein [Lachnospiraceae bacterium]
MRVSESICVGDLKKFVRSFFSLKNNCFIMFSGRGELPDEMSLADAGLCDGSGVMIGIEDEY